MPLVAQPEPPFCAGLPPEAPLRSLIVGLPVGVYAFVQHSTDSRSNVPVEGLPAPVEPAAFEPSMISV